MHPVPLIATAEATTTTTAAQTDAIRCPTDRRTIIRTSLSSQPITGHSFTHTRPVNPPQTRETSHTRRTTTSKNRNSPACADMIFSGGIDSSLSQDPVLSGVWVVCSAGGRDGCCRSVGSGPGLWLGRRAGVQGESRPRWLGVVPWVPSPGPLRALAVGVDDELSVDPVADAALQRAERFAFSSCPPRFCGRSTRPSLCAGGSGRSRPCGSRSSSVRFPRRDSRCTIRPPDDNSIGRGAVVGGEPVTVREAGDVAGVADHQRGDRPDRRRTAR